MPTGASSEEVRNGDQERIDSDDARVAEAIKLP